MRYANPPSVDQIAAKVCGAQRDAVPGERVIPSRRTRPVAAHRERRGVESGSRQVQEPVDEALAPRSARRLGPVGQAGDGRRHGAREPDRNRHVGGFVHRGIVTHRCDRIQNNSCGPGTDRDVGENWMKRVSEPDAVHRVLDRGSGRSGAFVYGMDRVRDRLS